MKRIVQACLILFSVMLMACTSMEEKREGHMAEARSLEREGRCAEAARKAGEALALDPALAEGHLLVARCDFKANNAEGAAGNYDRALTADPNSVEALLGLGRIALLSNRLDKAEEYVGRAAALGDSSLELFVIRSGILMKREKFAEALPLLEKALELAPNNEEAIVGLAAARVGAGERARAKELLSSSLEKLPGSRALSTLLLTLLAQDAEYPAAEELLRKMLLADPENDGLILQLSELLTRAGKVEEGGRVLRDFLEKRPHALAARMRLAEMEIGQNRLDDALALLDAAPQQTAVLALDKASVLVRAGRLDEGIALLRKTAEETTDDRPAAERARMALAEIFLQQGKADEAEGELNAVLAQNPVQLNALFSRGRLRLGQKRFPEAMADLESVVKSSPDNLPAVITLAEAAGLSGNYALAEALITRVNQRAPKYAQGYIAMANLYLAQEKPDAALMTLRMGKAEMPGDPALAFAETDVLIGLKRYGDAVSALEKLTGQKELAEAALMRLADVYAAKNDHPGAVKAYERLLAANPGIPGLREASIQAMIAAKQEKAALAAAEKLQKEKADDPGAAFLTAEAAMAAKNKKRAEECYLRALDLAPQWDQPLAALLQMYAGDKKIDTAIALCTRLAAKVPEAPGPGFFLGVMRERKGELAAAEKAYRAVLEKHPDMAPAAGNLAFLLSTGKSTPQRLAEAEKLAETAAKAGAPASLHTLGWVQHRLGKNAEAEGNLRRALVAYANNPVVTYHLAVTLADLGKSGSKTPEGKAKLAEARKLLEPLAARNGVPYQREAKQLLTEIRAVK